MTLNEGLESVKPLRNAALCGLAAIGTGTLAVYAHTSIKPETPTMTKGILYAEQAGFGIFAALIGGQAISLCYRAVRQAYRKVNE